MMFMSIVSSLYSPDDVGSVLYFSDNAPEGLASSLSGSFKKAYQVCKLAGLAKLGSC